MIAPPPTTAYDINTEYDRLRNRVVNGPNKEGDVRARVADVTELTTTSKSRSHEYVAFRVSLSSEGEWRKWIPACTAPRLERSRAMYVINLGESEAERTSSSTAPESLRADAHGVRRNSAATRSRLRPLALADTKCALTPEITL
ncbi:unnamed protein product [Leptosia nina]|uniref:Uncharacterized protein n=1 Tax=Leptosia nina TaxID=320188 RepID=A0AAV1JRF1_9NEOP